MVFRLRQAGALIAKTKGMLQAADNRAYAAKRTIIEVHHELADAYNQAQAADQAVKDVAGLMVSCASGAYVGRCSAADTMARTPSSPNACNSTPSRVSLGCGQDGDG